LNIKVASDGLFLERVGGGGVRWCVIFSFYAPRHNYRKDGESALDTCAHQGFADDNVDDSIETNVERN
jgi:hypothetical protein